MFSVSPPILYPYVNQEQQRRVVQCSVTVLSKSEGLTIQCSTSTAYIPLLVERDGSSEADSEEGEEEMEAADALMVVVGV